MGWFYVLTTFTVVFAIVLAIVIYKNVEGKKKKLLTALMSGALISLIVGLFYISYLDEKAFVDADISEIENVKITDVYRGYIEIIYWLDDNKLQKGKVDIEEIKIGTEVSLAIKDDIDYVLGFNGYGHERIQHLTLTEEKLEELDIRW